MRRDSVRKDGVQSGERSSSTRMIDRSRQVLPFRPGRAVVVVVAGLCLLALLSQPVAAQERTALKVSFINAPPSVRVHILVGQSRLL